jgi:hypothetical protein
MPIEAVTQYTSWATWGIRWLDTKTANVRDIMSKRMALVCNNGGDGLDPDNVDTTTIVALNLVVPAPWTT